MKPVLSNFLFWDCSQEKLDYDKRVNFILERVFSMGTEDDVREVVRYYGIDTIKKEIVKIKVLDKKTINYLSFTFKIPKRRFSCFRKNVYQNLY
ncbi:DUF6922 domain-containing protein [Leadbettera azotonutricia]|uniref:DUF6922 domain-containing protein n=1 Tax=Leadbettera azotonutricia (strain ATCC BAA-888 / DSM 13862 / ZAS-9) TaxID=545695 RepID=F5YC15_LEAAZ|nr:hypothetical protein [Leadbettera azotonutricia]AEF83164.1 conserved hypothetical protein [Leadbettera azotonutricia ZAS-9]